MTARTTRFTALVAMCPMPPQLYKAFGLHLSLFGDSSRLVKGVVLSIKFLVRSLHHFQVILIVYQLGDRQVTVGAHTILEGGARRVQV